MAVAQSVEFGLSDVTPGDHICGGLFRVAERDAVLQPFVRAGLQSADTCVCIGDAREPATVLEQLGPEWCSDAVDDTRFVPQRDQIVLCLDDLARFGGGMVVDNAYFLTPDEFRFGRS